MGPYLPNKNNCWISPSLRISNIRRTKIEINTSIQQEGTIQKENIGVYVEQGCGHLKKEVIMSFFA